MPILTQGLNYTGAAARSALTCWATWVTVTALGLIATITLPLAGATTALALPQQEVSPCVPIVDKWVQPERVLLGETVDVTITVRPGCPPESVSTHLVLVLDASGTMAGTPTQQMKQAAAGLVRGLDMDQHPETKVGVVGFNTTARTLSPLTNEERRAIGAINRVGASGGTRIDAGILEGIRVMRQGRGNEKNVTEIMVVLADGGNNAGCSPVLQAARQARGQGILLIAVCVGPGCDEQCMRQVASSPRYYFRAENANAIQSVFQQIRDKVYSIELKRLRVTETITSSLRYVADSAAPPQTAPTSPIDWLMWQDTYVTTGGVTLTYRLLPVKAGYLPVGAQSTGALNDNQGRERTFTLPVKWITVLQPSVLLTPGWTATITPSATPTVTPSPTASPTRTITPTPRPRPIYLPYDSRET